MYQPYGPGPTIVPVGMRPRFYRAAIDLSEEDIPPDVQERILPAEEFTCPICIEHPVNPVIILPCGHTLCDGCADEHASHGGLNGLNATCPECRGPMDHMTDYNNFCYMFCPERLDPRDLEQLNADIAEEGEHVDGPHPHPPRLVHSIDTSAGYRQQPGPPQDRPEYYEFEPFEHYTMPPRYYMHAVPMQDPYVHVPTRAMEAGFLPPYRRTNPNPAPRPHRSYDFLHPYDGMRRHDDMPWRDASCGHDGGYDAAPDDAPPASRYPNSTYTGELPIPDIGNYNIRPGAFVRRRRPRRGG
jgi:hypothetical protein